jgi:SAM-dependent methyltransferase
MENLKNLRSDCGQFILPIKTLQKLSQDKKFKLLDVGAAESLIKKFLPKNIEYSSLDCIGEQDFVHNLDKFPIPIKDNSFDIIVCLETLEHTLYPHKVMTELKRIAKPNALFLLSMPNEYNFYCRLNFLIGKKTDVQEPFQVIEKHLHIQLPRVKDLIKFFSSYVQIEEIDYQWYSRTGGHNLNFKGKFFVFVDKMINKFFTRLIPSLFTRTVVVKGINKK